MLVAPSNIRSSVESRSLNCSATASVAESRLAGRAPALQRLPQAIRNAKREKRGQNCEIGREMRRETPVLADVAEAAASNVESANFCGNRRERKGHNQHHQDRQRAAIEKSKNKRERAEDFQPRKIKRQRDTDGPRQNFVIIDVAGELNRIDCFERSRVNENAGQNKIENAPDD